MAEAIGLASSIVALVQLSASVYSTISKFYREAKEANARISALATQTRNLSGVLQSLSLLASAPLFDDAGVTGPDFRNTYMESCHATLHKIKRKLEKAESDIESGSHKRLVTRSLKWPFTLQETNELTAELGQHRDVLQLAVSAETMSQLLHCLADTKSTAKSIQNLNHKFDRKENIDTRAKSTAKREEVVRFFLKVNPQHQLQDCRNRRQLNTGRWLIERNETFRDWLNSSGSRIWLSGIPGVGKTILCGTVIEEILQRQSPSTAAAFFFCDYKSRQSQEPVNVLGALAVQLAQQGDAAFELLESYYEELHPQNGLAKPTETKGIVEVIQTMIDEYDSVYLVIDGLDECGPKAVELILALKELARGDQVTMALFSRNEPDIADELSDSLRIEIAAHTEDLELYVLAQMENRKRLKSLAVKNAKLHEHILHTLIEGAHGMFRWVACQLDYLDGLPSDGRRRKALTELPPTLFETYDRILDRMLQDDNHGREICRKALHWIGVGFTRISPEALCEAVSIPDDKDRIDKELLVDIDWLSRSCSSLIRLARQEPCFPHFQLAHFTVKEYLRSIKPDSKRSIFRFSEDEATEELFQTSLRFLTFRNFDEAPTIASSEIQRMSHRNKQHPFYPFAAGYTFSCSGEFGYWPEGSSFDNLFTKVVRDEEMMKYAVRLFNPDKTAIFLSWVLQAIWGWPGQYLGKSHFTQLIGLLVAPEFSTLHVAASLAIPSICTHLLGAGRVDLNMSCRLGTPLHGLLAGITIYHPKTFAHFQYDPYTHVRRHARTRRTSSNESRLCLEILIRHGADTSARLSNVSCFQMAVNNAIQLDGGWIEPLATPSTEIQEASIKDLKAGLAGRRASGPFFDAILGLACMPEIPPIWGRLALSIRTSRIEHVDIARDIPMEIQRKLSDEDFIDAVRISLDQNLIHTLATLLQDSRFHPNIYIPCDAHMSEPILHFAIRKGSPSLIRMLFRARCDPKVVDETDGWTVLHQCAQFNTDYAANAMLLLRSGVMDSIRNVKGKTCWHIAAEQGNNQVLEALIQLGSDAAKSLQTTSKEGRTPLASAVLNANVDSALLLLDHCNEKVEVFQSDESLLDKAVGLGSHDLFTRLHEKMKQAGAKETRQGSKHINNINMTCSPKLLDYMLITWTTDNRSRCDALANYLLDVNNTKFEDPAMYPKRADLDHIIRQLLPLPVGVHEQGSAVEFWSTFCDKVLVSVTKLCGHDKHRCRRGLVDMILDILIEAEVLDSYEQNTHRSSYKALFQSLLDRSEDVKCSWVAPSVHKVMKVSNLSKDLANDIASNKLLSLAIKQSSIDIVKQLLHHGVDVDAAHGVFSPVEQACYASDLPTFELIIKQSDGSQFNRAGNQGKTLLHWAVSGTVPGYLTKIQRLLKLGVDIDAKVDDANEDTALTLASRSESVDAVALLVSEGADVLHQALDGWSVLHAAALTGDLRYIRSLNRLGSPELFWRGTCQYPLVRIENRSDTMQNVTAIHLAAARGKSNFLHFMAQHNLLFDVNAGFPALTPLHLASLFGHLDVVRFLVSAKANINARSASNELPINLAAREGHLAVVKYLMQTGSEPISNVLNPSISLLLSNEKEDTEDSTDSLAMAQFLFEQAIMIGDLDRCKTMANRGRFINANLLTNSYTPLVRAVVQGRTAIVDWLVSSAVEVRDPFIASLHPSLRCVISLVIYHISSPQTLSALMSLALKQSKSWYGSILGPLHVAVVDNKVEGLEEILRHIRENDQMYRKIIETELLCVPAEIINWRGRTALSILVNSFNREEALSGDPPWEVEWPPGSPLHWAIRNSDVAAVRLLLKNEADVNQADSLAMTPLELAVLSEQPLKLVHELLQAGAGIAEPSGSRLDAMRDAVCNGDLEVVRILAEADPDTLKAVDQYTANTLLEDAGSAAVFQYLVSRGGDPFNVFQAEETAFTWLIRPKSHLKCFVMNSGLAVQSSDKSLAFARGSATFTRGSEGTRRVKMLRSALSGGIFTRVVNLTNGDNGSPLCIAASISSAGTVEALIKTGTELNPEGCRYGSPLMAACAWGNLDAARVLVRAGSALCYVNDEGLLRSAISAASRHQKVKNWLLVDRYTEQPKIDCQPSQVTSHESVWSGPRLFRLALPAYMHRDFDESRWSHLRRLQKWREELRGAALADSRRNSGLDFYAESEAGSRIKAAEAAHESFLMKLGETR